MTRWMLKRIPVVICALLMSAFNLGAAVAFQNSGFVVVSGEACYSGSFPPGSGLALGGRGRVLAHSNGQGATVHGAADLQTYLGELPPGESFTVLEGPLCRYDAANPLFTQRIWKIDASLQGWALEYNRFDASPPVILLAPLDSPAPPLIQVNAFTLSVQDADFDEEVTIHWDISGAQRFGVALPNGTVYDQTSSPPNSSVTLTAGQLAAGTNPARVTLYAADAQENVEFRELSLKINSDIAIASFTAAPENPPSNGSVILNWTLDGTTQGRITWNDVSWQVPVTLAEVTAAQGSHVVTLKDEYRPYIFVLTIVDHNGVPTSQEITVRPTCPYTFFVSDPAYQGERCPESDPLVAPAALQTFERGFMVWWQAAGGGTIDVFFSDGTHLQRAYEWGGQGYEPGAAPAGLAAPANGFGWLWTQEQLVRDGLGWATGPEQSYTTTMQSAEYPCGKWLVATPTWLTLPDGRAVRHTSSCAAPGWAFVS